MAWSDQIVIDPFKIEISLYMYIILDLILSITLDLTMINEVNKTFLN